MVNGQWNLIHTDAAHPFVIGDAPVVTWERTEDGQRHFGKGFATSNVEVFLPISPTTCVHVLPDVERTRVVRTATSAEVNAAQAAFATDYCYANVNSDAIDAILKQEFGKVKIGVTGFIPGNTDHKRLLFDVLMDRLPTAVA